MGANELLRLALLTDRDRNIIFNLRPRTRALSQGVGYKGRGEGRGLEFNPRRICRKKKEGGEKKKKKGEEKNNETF